MPRLAGRDSESPQNAERQARALVLKRAEVESLLLNYWKGTTLTKERAGQLASTIRFAASVLRYEPISHAIIDIPSAIDSQRPIKEAEVTALVRAFGAAEEIVLESLFPKRVERVQVKTDSRLAKRIEEMRRTLSGKTDAKEKIFELISETPGLYIKQIYHRLVGAGLDFSYGAIHAAVQKLIEERQILAIGGAQGRPRFCFPHPDAVDPSRYYGSLFAIEGVVGENVESVGFSRSGQFEETFLVHTEAKPYLLVLPFGVVSQIGGHIRAFGLLSPPGEAKETPAIQGTMVEFMSEEDAAEYWVDRNRYSNLILQARQEIEL